MKKPNSHTHIETTGSTCRWPPESAWRSSHDHAGGRPRAPRRSDPPTKSTRSLSRRHTPLKGYGSKSNLVRTILPLLPTHEKYVEVFGGTGAVLFTKLPSKMEVFNDINNHIVEFFEVLQDRKKRARLAQLLRDTPYGREEYRRCAERFETETDPVERARQFYVLTHQSINGRLRGGWSRDRRVSRAKQFRNGQRLLRQASERLRHVVIENVNFEKLLDYYDGRKTLFYLDPPYPGLFTHLSDFRDAQPRSAA